MLSRSDLIDDLADVLHETRLRHLVDGWLPGEYPARLPTEEDRELAEEIVDRLAELGLLDPRRDGDTTTAARVRRRPFTTWH
jgi:hypothetical protein